MGRAPEHQKQELWKGPFRVAVPAEKAPPVCHQHHAHREGPGETSVRQVSLEIASQHSGEEIRYRHTEDDRNQDRNKLELVHALTTAADRTFATS